MDVEKSYTFDRNNNIHSNDMSYHLEVCNVRKAYATYTALNDVSFGLERGKIFGLLGPNGAGKTSLIRIINRITAPDSGTIYLNGHPIKGEDIVRIGYLPEERGLYRKMKVGEQALYLARLKGMSKHEATQKLKYWFDRLDILSWWNKRIEELSKGMQQKIQFVCSIVHEPELLILDEPFSGFDPINAEILKQEILTLKQEGRTIILSTHNMQSVEELCDDIAMLHQSNLVLSGSVSDIRRAHATGKIALRLDKSHTSQQELQSLGMEHIELHPDSYTCTLTLDTSRSIRDIILSLPPHLRLMEIKEELPSMHDIFIHTIQDNSLYS